MISPVLIDFFSGVLVGAIVAAVAHAVARRDRAHDERIREEWQ